MAAIDLHGVFPPITTPFSDGKIAYDKLLSNVEKWSQTGIKGFVVLGSNGEYVHLSEDEKIRVVKTVIQAAPDDLLVIAGTGCESTQESIRMTHACAELGADAALLITPHFFGSRMNDAALIRHFTEVADRSPIPAILYNVSKFTHLNMTVNAVATLSQHSNIIGIKDSAGNVGQLGEFLNQVDKNFDVLVGTAGVLYGGLTLGCTGGILALANVAPENCVKIHAWVRSGHLDKAREMQLRMIPVNTAVTAKYGVPGLKAAMDMVGYFGGSPRLPLLPLSQEDRTALKAILIRSELL